MEANPGTISPGSLAAPHSFQILHTYLKLKPDILLDRPFNISQMIPDLEIPNFFAASVCEVKISPVSTQQNFLEFFVLV